MLWQAVVSLAWTATRAVISEDLCVLPISEPSCCRASVIVVTVDSVYFQSQMAEALSVEAFDGATYDTEHLEHMKKTMY